MNNKVKLYVISFICCVFLSIALGGVEIAEAAPLKASDVPVPPNATKVVKNKDGNFYALYKGNVCALTKLKQHAKSVTVPKYIKVKGKRYKVVAIHELQLWERKDIKKVTIKATNMETVEDPTLFKSWRNKHHVKLSVKITNKEMKKWLNERW